MSLSVLALHHLCSPVGTKGGTQPPTTLWDWNRYLSQAHEHSST